MKIISNKRYKELLDCENKYRLLTGQTVTFCTGERRKYKALLSMEKEEKIKELDDILNDRENRVKKLKQYIKDIWNIDIYDFDEDDYYD